MGTDAPVRADLPQISEVNTDSLGNSIEEVSETLSGELIGLYEEKEQEYGADLLREVEQSVMLQVIDTRWLQYLTQMDHLREGMGFQAYGQMDPLVEYKAAAFTAFQDLTEDIQREIVRALLNVQIRRVDPALLTAEIAEGAGGRRLRTALNRLARRCADRRCGRGDSTARHRVPTGRVARSTVRRCHRRGQLRRWRAVHWRAPPGRECPHR